MEVFKEFSISSDEVLDIYLARYRELIDDSTRFDAERERLHKELDKIDQRKSELLDLKIDGVITLDEFKKLMSETREKAAGLEKELDDMEDKEELASDLEAQIKRLKISLQHGMEDIGKGIITRDFVDTYISRIDVNPLGDGVLEVNIRILTNDVIRCRMEKLSKGRTGHTFKKMIESYEKNL